MRFSIRTKLITIISIVALGFALLIAIGGIIDRQVSQQLTAVRKRYVPKIQLRPELEAKFALIRRSLQDAVAAQDTDLLNTSRRHKDAFLVRLASASDVIDRAEAASLRKAVSDYYAVAYNVSHRLTAGETGEALVDAMAEMQQKHKRAARLLEQTTAFDQKELSEAFAAVGQARATAGRIRLTVSLACLFFANLFLAWLSRGMLRSVKELVMGFERFGQGQFNHLIHVSSKDEFSDVAEEANRMAANLRELSEQRDRQDWLKNSYAGLTHELRGELEPEEVANRAVRFIARCLDLPAAALYYRENDDQLTLLGQYALSGSNTAQATSKFRMGEGLVGQAALCDELTIVNDLPADYLRVRSGLGEGLPKVLAFASLVHANRVTGVLELASFKPWPDLWTELVTSLQESLAIAIEVAGARSRMRELLSKTRAQAERLATQEEELRSTNEELQTQQEELRQANEELTEQAEELENQRRVLEASNVELEGARQTVEHKAKELATVSAYKSQFLANMSHELRTPLNSMLLLSNILIDNEAGNLTDKQVEFCKTIHSAGKDLLALINQVLDLAKIEAGRQQISIAPVSLTEVAEHLRSVFEPLAEHKGLEFIVELEPGLPDIIRTDRQRLEQILTNLLGNAIKFTHQGHVALRMQRPESSTRFRRSDLHAEQAVAFCVSDTGLGIAAEQNERIYVPFEQVDNATDRHYGGTGLGLTITRELSVLLGGELELVQSTLGKGSTFVCTLPEQAPISLSQSEQPTPSEDLSQPVVPAVTKATHKTVPLEGSTGLLLIIEDDEVFAETVGEIIEAQGLNYVLARNGHDGISMARQNKPTGIILDVKLPDISGWRVFEQLRANPQTATIPVHFISAVDETERGMAMGAVGYLVKPASRHDIMTALSSLVPRLGQRAHRVLLVEDDPAVANSLARHINDENMQTHHSKSAHEALEMLRHQQFACLIVDLSLPDMDGLTFLQSLQEQCGSKMPSVIVYTGRALSKIEVQRLETYAEAVVLKEGASSERLLSEIRLFVRRMAAGSASDRTRTSLIRPKGVHLEGKKLLVVDDDMRTVYALSALLQAKGAEIFTADTGRAALDVLGERPDIDLVLIDIMMPEMDGYEAMRHIRAQPRFAKLPVIALTAKAMKGDREKCLQAGASDYLSKPIDADRLFTLMQSHLSALANDSLASA